MNRWRVLVNFSIPLLEGLRDQLASLLSADPMTPEVEAQIILMKKMISAQEELIKTWKFWAGLDDWGDGGGGKPSDLIKKPPKAKKEPGL